MPNFSIEIDTGAQFCRESDIEAALEAARQAWARTGGDWEVAESEANLALTNSWHDPNGAYCSLLIDGKHRPIE